MGNGWETRRRRGKGFDWVLIKLGYPGKMIILKLASFLKAYLIVLVYSF